LSIISFDIPTKLFCNCFVDYLLSKKNYLNILFCKDIKLTFTIISHFGNILFALEEKRGKKSWFDTDELIDYNINPYLATFKISLLEDSWSNTSKLDLGFDLINFEFSAFFGF
jgi:hypothetical protein